jgi:hypothetical protein
MNNEVIYYIQYSHNKKIQKYLLHLSPVSLMDFSLLN